MLTGTNNKTMTTKTGEESENKEMAEEGSKGSRPRKSKENKFQDQDEEMKRAGADLTARMAEALADLANTLEVESFTTPPVDPLSNDEAGKDYSKGISGAKSGDINLSLSDYDSDALEVSYGEFEAAHGQKYQDPANFLQALWNEAGPTVGSMKIMLNLMRAKFKGEVAGLKADLTIIPQVLINFLINESGEDSNNAIDFIDNIAEQLNKFNKERNAGDGETGESDALPPDKEDEPSKASKTQGMLPKAPEANPTEGTTTATTTTVEGDKKGTQSMSMASGE